MRRINLGYLIGSMSFEKYVKVCFLIMFLFVLAFAVRENVYEYPLIDDSFIYFTIAKNISDGEGVSDDGEHLTNGFQPLFAFLIAPIFILTGDNLLVPIRIILLLQIGIFIFCALLAGKIASEHIMIKDPRLKRVMWYFSALIYFASPHLLKAHLNGLETGLLMLLYLILWRFYQLTGIQTDRQAVIFGFFLGLTILARNDAGFFAIAFVVVFFAFRISVSNPWCLTRRIVIIASISFLVTLPWWYYNHTVFDSLVPTSGRAMSVALNGYSHPYFASSFYYRFASASGAVIGNLLPLMSLLWLDLYRITAIILRLLIWLPLVIVLLFSRNRWSEWEVDATVQKRSNSRQFALTLTLACIALVAYYTHSIVSVWFYGRYFIPISLVSFIAIIVPALDWFFSRIHLKIWTMIIAAYVGYSCMLIVASLFGFSVYSGSFRPQLDLINAHVPQNEIIASVESGYVSYFRGKVVNLDGKTNADLYSHLDQGDILPYVYDRNICWLVVFDMNTHFAPTAKEDGWEYIDTDRTGRWKLYHYFGTSQNCSVAKLNEAGNTE